MSALSSSAAKVLVVDDEDNARSALVELLTDAGYDVSAAISGEDALQRVADSMPDVVLTDVRMHGMNGLALASILRAMPLPPQIAFMSASSPPEPRPMPWLAKPLDLDSLLATIEGLASRRKR
jgi:two-component system response regulator HydG